MEDKIIGTVEKIIFKSENTGFYVLSVLRNENKLCTVTTNHLRICEWCSYEFTGEWVTNNKYGVQLKATNVVEIPPSSKDAMVNYLSSTFFKGIGPVIAKKIVAKFGDDTYNVLKTNIEKLLKVPGISKKKFDIIKRSWLENSEINEIMLFLQSYDISTLYASKIYEFFGKDCVFQIKNNPYKLQLIGGIGFKYSDKIALNLGFKKDSVERISAGIKYVLEDGENNDGHCFLYYDQLIQKSNEILGISVEEKINDVLRNLIEENEIKEYNSKYYSNDVYYAEKYVAHKISCILGSEKINVNEVAIAEWENKIKEDNITLSEEQKNSILGIIKNKVSILTGGAGCGKTLCLKYLIKLLQLLKVDFEIACPTGKASMRATEVTGCHSSTIHKLLGWNRIENTFLHNEKNLLNIQFLVIDESGMIDIKLMSPLLKAIPNDTHILFVGDDAQLSPIGPGSPFSNLINSNIINVYKLTKTFRQLNGAESDIIKCANDIRCGKEPIIESPLESPDIWTTNKKDCMFIDSGETEANKTFRDFPSWHSLFYGYDLLEMVKKLYLEIIPKYYPKNKIQIISPMNKGINGCDNINSIIRDIVNPSSAEKKEIDLKTRILRDNDFIINTINNYDIGIVNGEMGIIKSINTEEKSAIVEFEYENKTVELKRSDLLHLRHAYAVSCHKFQGSESPVVIAPLSMAHYPLLYRSMIYTLISRGKNLVVVIGERKALKVAIDNVKDNNRQTTLIEFLQSNINNSL